MHSEPWEMMMIDGASNPTPCVQVEVVARHVDSSLLPDGGEGEWVFCCRNTHLPLQQQKFQTNQAPARAQTLYMVLSQPHNIIYCLLGFFCRSCSLNM